MKTVETLFTLDSSEEIVMEKICKLIFTHIHKIENNSKQYELTIIIKSYE